MFQFLVVAALIGVAAIASVSMVNLPQPSQKPLAWPPRPIIPVFVPVAVEQDLALYHLSERTLINANAGLQTYLLSERTLIDPQAGMAAYFQSERTSVPLRDLDSFNDYQQSEWFGK